VKDEMPAEEAKARFSRRTLCKNYLLQELRASDAGAASKSIKFGRSGDKTSRICDASSTLTWTPCSSCAEPNAYSYKKFGTVQLGSTSESVSDILPYLRQLDSAHGTFAV
jgi:hypothetical protein